MKCSFCGNGKVEDEHQPICKKCRTALQKGDFPPIDLKEYFAKGLEQKLRDVESLITQLPENFFLWYLKGHLEHELGVTKKALNSIKTSLSFKEDYGDPWIRLGLIHSDMHKDAEAIDHYEKGLMYPLLDPSNLVDAGISLQASDQPKLASIILRRELDLAPEDDRAMVALGKVYVQMSELEEARKVLEKGIELYPHNEEVLRGMAQILLKLDDLDSAMEMYSRILDQHPRDFEALLAKGEIHLRRWELTQSLKAYHAVNELDIHISWAGILKFILSNLRSIMDLNENHLSYREDLRKEYENIKMVISDLEETVSKDQDPCHLGDIENLVKVLESLRLNLREQAVQFEGLLEKYRVDDSFHQHLLTKVQTLRSYLEGHRYFDSKQISLELTPFLSDLKTSDLKAYNRAKERVIQKFEELGEIGKMNEALFRRFSKVEELEKEGNQEGATFMLKEVEVSLEEYWVDVTKHYHEEKLEEIKHLLQEARNHFDTSALSEVLRSYRKKIDEGPRAITEVYHDFMDRYREDSSYYYLKESKRLVKEADLKILIMEKDGANIEELQEESRRLMDELEGSVDPQKVFSSANELSVKVEYLEGQQKISRIRGRLRDIEKLLGDVDYLGLDDELARNVEPVRRVIERSLKEENHRLSEVLINELYGNVEMILRENYSNGLLNVLRITEGEIHRLKGLNVQENEWMISLEKAGSILGTNEMEGMIEAVRHLARLQMNIQNFMIDKLPREIESRLHVCTEKLEKGIGYGFSLGREKSQLRELERASSDILSLEMLEEVCKFENDLSDSVSRLLEEKTSEMGARIREGIDELTNFGVDQRSLMDVLSKVNRSEVLMDSKDPGGAWELMNIALDLFNDLREKKLLELLEMRISEIKKLFELADQMTIDVSALSLEKSELLMEKGLDPDEDLRRAFSIHDRLMSELREQGGKKLLDLKEMRSNLLDSSSIFLPELMRTEIDDNLKLVEIVLESQDVTTLPALLEKIQDLLEGAFRESAMMSLLRKCSDIIEEGISIKDPKANEIVKKAQDLSGRIRSGESEGIEEVIISLQKEMRSVKDMNHLQKIENTLTEIKELDELAREVLDPIKDEKYSDRVEDLTRRMSGILDKTSALYGDPEPSYVDDLSGKIDALNEEIIEFEQEWRAHRRLEILNEMALTEETVTDRLLSEDILNLRLQFSSRDWKRFFRTWDRLEGHIKKMEKKGMLPGGSMRLIEAAPASPGLDILSRKRTTTGTASRPPPSWRRGGEGGITRLAKDLAVKKKLIEEPGKEDKTRDKERDQTIEKAGEADHLADMARSIAGTRIEKLKKSDSMAVKDGIPIMEIDTGEIIEDMMEIDTSMERKEVVDSEKVRQKLLLFFDRFPIMLKLDAVRSHFERGEKLFKSGSDGDALIEYRVAMSTAIKIGKVHMDMGKKLATVFSTLSRLREKGYESLEAEELYRHAISLFREGDLLGCARTIKSIRDALARKM
ncbi:MAG: tetratricopeptide repeat protein [Thermoplasmatota archaeon]